MIREEPVPATLRLHFVGTGLVMRNTACPVFRWLLGGFAV